MQLNIDNSLVLIIDIQERLLNAVFNKEEVQKKSGIIAGAADILKIPVIVTEQYPKGLGETIDSLKSCLNKETLFFEKTAFSALDDSLIADAISKFSRKQIILFGIETHICVYQTAIALLQKGFNVFVVKDACASRETDEFKAGINLMEKEGAKILTTEMVIFEMLKSSKHPNFKEVQALIK